MKILAIETSCDETALAILSVKGKKFKIEAHQIASQIALHTQYGGVFPMMAKREHSRNIVPLFLTTLKEAKIFRQVESRKLKVESQIRKLLAREQDMVEPFLTEIAKIKKPKIDRITVTVGPGLEPALWVGINFAKALSVAWNIPLVPVNHMEGHVLSALIKEQIEQVTSGKSGALHKCSLKVESQPLIQLKFPVISLLVSGGHTEIVLVKGIGKYKLVGQTRDDAAGEAFDKVARMLGLPYPGGPEISRLASQSRNQLRIRNEKLGIKELTPNTKNQTPISLPRPMIGTPDFDFSFSGLKTAVLYMLRDLGGVEKITDDTKAEIAREFEDAVVDVLIKKTLAAAKKYKAHTVIVGGGVSANNELTRRMTAKLAEEKIQLLLPTKKLSTDNAVMIGIAGSLGKKVALTSKKLIANGNLAL